MCFYWCFINMVECIVNCIEKKEEEFKISNKQSLYMYYICIKINFHIYIQQKDALGVAKEYNSTISSYEELVI